MTSEPTTPAKRPDLGIRVISGIVMIAIAVTAFWLGGKALFILIVAVALGVLVEAWGLVQRIAASLPDRALWMVVLALYVLFAADSLLNAPKLMLGLAMASVVATDIGAYFSGRAFGGPKIAPSISPSKTWAGLFGGMVGAAFVTVNAWVAVSYALTGFDGDPPSMLRVKWAIFPLLVAVAVGAVIAIVAQAGDFFESWLKRRAGVKDSGNLIPGHGGMFDRVDGLLAVACLLGLIRLAGWI